MFNSATSTGWSVPDATYITLKRDTDGRVAPANRQSHKQIQGYDAIAEELASKSIQAEIQAWLDAPDALFPLKHHIAKNIPAPTNQRSESTSALQAQVETLVQALSSFDPD